MFKLLVSVAFATCLLTGCEGTPPPTPPVTAAIVYGNDADYQELTAPESPWYGLVTRTAGGYTLTFGATVQPLYLKGGEVRLEPFINREVVLTGKLVEAGGTSVLWPAVLKIRTGGLLACSTRVPELPIADKLDSYTADLIAQRPGEQIEPILIGFCDDQTITPASTQEQLEVLRASSYVLLRRELAPYVVVFKADDWFLQGLAVDMRLDRVLELAERADVLSVTSANLTAPPP